MNTAARLATARPLRPVARFLVAILPVAAVSVLVSVATIPNIPGWYQALAKPPLNPPNGVFGPVWTILYALIAFAAWRILSRPPALPGRTGALWAFAVQLALNALWSWAFFGARSPLLGLFVIVPLLGTIVVTMRRFAALDRLAALLLAPYLAWVAFAVYLNAGVWWLNR
jgi:tryptophan-rich sensory protein